MSTSNAKKKTSTAKASKAPSPPVPAPGLQVPEPPPVLTVEEKTAQAKALAAELGLTLHTAEECDSFVATGNKLAETEKQLVTTLEALDTAQKNAAPVAVVASDCLPVPAAKLLCQAIEIRDGYPGAIEFQNYDTGKDGSHFNVRTTADGEIVIERRPPQGPVQVYENARNDLIKKRNKLQAEIDAIEDAAKRDALIDGDAERLETCTAEIGQVKDELDALVPVSTETQVWTFPKGPVTVTVSSD